MTNTDRLAQAAENASNVLAEIYAKYSTKIGPFATQAQKANGELRAALASLAPAAVEGDAALFVNNCENALDESTKMWRRVISGEGHDMVAFQTPIAHAMQQCLRNARGVVAALTAQCEGLRKDAKLFAWLEQRCYSWTYDGIAKPYVNVRIWMPDGTDGAQQFFDAHSHDGVGKISLRNACSAAIAAGNGEGV